MENLPKAFSKEIHFITMLHGSPGQNLGNYAIKSQEQVMLFLKEIQPDMVGKEGYSGEYFTTKKYIEEYIIATGNKPDQNFVNRLVYKYENNMEYNGVIRFQNTKPACTFVGVEDQALNLLHIEIGNMVVQLQNQNNFLSKEDNLMRLYRELMFWRGTMMIANFGKKMTKTNVKKGAFPIGHDHSTEIQYFIKNENPPWSIHHAEVNYESVIKQVLG